MYYRTVVFLFLRAFCLDTYIQRKERGFWIRGWKIVTEFCICRKVRECGGSEFKHLYLRLWNESWSFTTLSFFLDLASYVKTWRAVKSKLYFFIIFQSLRGVLFARQKLSEKLLAVNNTLPGQHTGCVWSQKQARLVWE